MSLKGVILDKHLPQDAEVLAALRVAKESGVLPAQHIGHALESALACGKEEFPFFIKRYPQTLAWLCEPGNMDWLIADMERTLKYLRDMSKWMNGGV